MKRYMVGYAIVGAVIMTGGMLFGAGVQHSVDTHTVTHSQSAPSAALGAHLPACKDEDGDNCIWDAAEAGNGVGSSFIAYHGHVYYLETANMDKKMGW